MIIWIDAQLSPALSRWFRDTLGIEAVAVAELGLRDATDRAIFTAARQAGAVVLTKDRDFAALLEQHGPPPQVVWVTCGNTSTKRLSDVLQSNTNPLSARTDSRNFLSEKQDLAGLYYRARRGHRENPDRPFRVLAKGFGVATPRYFEKLIIHADRPVMKNLAVRPAVLSVPIPGSRPMTWGYHAPPDRIRCGGDQAAGSSRLCANDT